MEIVNVRFETYLKGKRQPKGCRFKCFHNGIILIVNCFQFIKTKLQIKFHYSSSFLILFPKLMVVNIQDMKKVLGLDLGTNSIGWALVSSSFAKKEGAVNALGSRIIPMDQKEIGEFDSGNTISQTATRTAYRGVRRLYQRDNLRRERLHRVLNVLNFLPEHYKNEIDFENKLGQFKKEVKINSRKV